MQLLLGNTKGESTVRYLGVELEDAMSIAERIDIEVTLASGPTARQSIAINDVVALSVDRGVTPSMQNPTGSVPRS